MSERPNSAAARDIAYQLHPYTNARKHEADGPLIIERGEGDPRLRRPGSLLYRGPVGPLVRVPRLQRGAPGGGRDAAAQDHALLPQLRAQDRHAGDRPGREADRASAGADVQGLLCQLGLRGQRFRGQAGLVRQQRPGPAGAQEDHQPHQGLPRRHGGLGQHDRAALQPPRLRPADPEHPAYLLPAPLPLRRGGGERGGLRDPHGRGAGADDPGGRPRDHRRLHRRARDGRRRRAPAAPRPIGRRSRQS